MRKDEKNQLILQMSYRDLLLNLVISQLFFLLLGFGLSFIFFDSLSDWLNLITFSFPEIVAYGVMPGLAVVAVDWILMKYLSEEHYDDGGINKKLFKEAPVNHIFLIALLVAVAEEILFRGVIQTVFGVYIASFLFAFVHFRYLKKPALFLSVIILSFSLGFIYKWTENLLVPIAMHFTIDFVLGLIIHREGQVQE